MFKVFSAITALVRRFRTQRFRLHADIAQIRSILIDNYILSNLHGNPRYADPKRLNGHEHQVYSQNGEDGIIEAIFDRIGTTNRVFVEIGVEDGLEANSTYLLLKGWSGHWFEADPDGVAAIQDKFSGPIARRKIKVRECFVTAENVEEIMGEEGVPPEFDLLSIDINGNDYWVWKAMERFNPRAVVIEYNAMFRDKVKWVMRYDPSFIWDGASHFNSSLKSLELLGEKKGYCLVGCNYLGVNAFFVRRDLVADDFRAPYTAENHFEPIRYHLQKKDGFARDFRDFEDI